MDRLSDELFAGPSFALDQDRHLNRRNQCDLAHHVLEPARGTYHPVLGKEASEFTGLR